MPGVLQADLVAGEPGAVEYDRAVGEVGAVKGGQGVANPGQEDRTAGEPGAGEADLTAGDTEAVTDEQPGHNLPDATTRSRGLSGAGGGSVAAIASAIVFRSAAIVVMTAMSNLRNIWSCLPARSGSGTLCDVSLAVRSTRETSLGRRTRAEQRAQR
jgi:hypothetical protein